MNNIRNLSLDTQIQAIFYPPEGRLTTSTMVSGYPKVVGPYLGHAALKRLRVIRLRLSATFTNESIRYFTDIPGHKSLYPDLPVYLPVF